MKFLIKNTIFVFFFMTAIIIFSKVVLTIDANEKTEKTFTKKVIKEHKEHSKEKHA